MPQDNRDLIQKADFMLAQLTSGGLLNAEQLDRFIRLAIDRAVVMPEMTKIMMKSPTQERDKIRFGSRALRKGSEATALATADRARPDISKVELAAQLVKAEARVSLEALEDSIEQGQFAQTVQDTLAERISADLEDLAFNGDTSSSDSLLSVLDGFILQATTNTVAAGSVALSRSLLKDMLKTMPSEFRTDRRMLRYYTADEAVIDYHELIGDRETPLGDSKIMGMEAPPFEGIPVKGVPKFPTNLGTGTDETVALLLDPKNMLFGVWRNMRVDTDKDIQAGVWILVITARVDFKYAHEPAVVQGTAITAV